MSSRTLEIIDSSIEISAPVERVFEAMTDVANWTRWAHGVKRARLLSPGPMRRGSRVYFVPRFFPAPIVAPVLEFAVERTIEWGVRSPVGGLWHGFAFEPIDEHRCRVRQWERADGIAAVLVRPLAKGIHDFDAGWAEDLRRLFAAS